MAVLRFDIKPLEAYQTSMRFDMPTRYASGNSSKIG